MGNSHWKLFLDETRDPPLNEGYTVARSSIMGTYLCIKRKTLPEHVSFGTGEDAARFLKELYVVWRNWGSDSKMIPTYSLHDRNEFSVDIVKFMEFWKSNPDVNLLDPANQQALT